MRLSKKEALSLNLILLIIMILLVLLSNVPAEASSIKAPVKVTNLKAKVTSTSTVQLDWKKISNANGYQVFIKTQKQKWKKKITLKGANSIKYTCKSLSANTEYQYRVRAYRAYKSNGKTKYVFGAFSKITSVKTKKAALTLTLKDGYYTAGIDIPAGIFNVTAIAGIGYINSEIDSANLRGPEYKEKDFSDYSRSFNNYQLSKGTILEIAGVQIKIKYSKVTASAKGRSYDTKRGIKLTPGNYIVGKHIKPGRYCVKYISGEGGYVSSNRWKGDCIINSNMDGDPDTGEYVDYVSNIVLQKGEKLQVTTGLTVLFIPEKK